MSKCVKWKCSFATVALLLLTVITYAETGQIATSISAVQALVSAAFPELSREPVGVMVIAHVRYDRAWTHASPISVLVRGTNEPIGELDSPTPEEDEARLLGGFFSMIFVEGTPAISSAHFAGRHVHTAERRELTTALKELRPRTDDEAATMLAGHGANYGPDQREAFMRELNIERFGPALGGVIDHDGRFIWRQVFEEDETREAREDIIEPGWLVMTRSASAGGHEICHLMGFEPFAGRLTSLQRLGSCPAKTDTQAP